MEKSGFIRGLATVAVALSAAACGRPPGPEPLELDRVNCSQCGMLVSSLRNAAQAIVPNQETRFYDDIGCLLRDAAAREPAARAYVQLNGGSGWILARDAFYAMPADAQTPMGHGVIAFATEDAARAADRARQARRWEELLGDRGDGQ